jgi:predicted RNA-binding Zn ribbon-like protein
MDRPTAAYLDLVGDRLCLDFANTAAYDADMIAREHLHGFADILAWGRHIGLTNTAGAALLRRRARQDTGEAADVHLRVLALRGALVDLLAGSGGSLDLLNREIRIAGDCRLVRRGRAFGFEITEGLAAWVIGPVAASALDLLTSADRYLVQRCQGESCGWFFIDRTRGHPRRWCSMAVCGNRAKAQAFYRRHRT